MRAFITLQLYLLGIFYASFYTLYTKLLLYIKGECTYSEFKCNHTYYSGRIEKWDITIKQSAVLWAKRL